MQTHDNLVQGSPEWHAYRAQHFNASDAPAMMSCSPYKTREQLLREVATGIVPEVDAATQKIFDTGHRFEENARTLAVQMLGEELFPVVGSDGELSASLDGLTMLGETIWEHKTLNKDLRKAFADIETIEPAHRKSAGGRCLPLLYRVQMEQQLAVAQADQVLFTASKWADDGTLLEVQHCWYFPDLELRGKIVAGWAQFKLDLQSFNPATADPAPKVVAEVVTDLPVVYAQVHGELTLTDNLPDFEKALRVFVERRLITSPETDQDFANLEQQIKTLKKAEDALDASEEQAFSQTSVLSAFKRTKDMLRTLAREHRLTSEKLLSTEKDRIKLAQVQRGRQALADHIAALNKRLGKPYMPTISNDFAGAIKNKRTVESLKSSINAELARAKIAANEAADLIQLNLNTLREIASQHAFLFADTAQLVLKTNDDVATLARARIAEHDAKEAARLDAEREKIRREEQERADREARARLEQQQREEQRLRDEAAAADAQLRADAIRAEQEAQAGIAEARATEALPAAILNDLSSLARDVRADVVAGVDARQAISTAQRTSAVAPAAASAAPTGTPTLKIGVINERLQVFKISEEGLNTLGITPAARERGNPLYHEIQFPAICAAAIEHLSAVAERYLDERASA
ncbi:YqaJ viral recombinase family protein [Diaphorobacter caeni]|uniref:YqaJ viral recombinase family protein n=1 Tax=Diaphorobacter caeni TaxID=2784387 RepID=UPI00188F98E1|nr:YqaJ viral recombinase family protein [Diaphorobacter caeni]MBF5006887.1 YqaJ viral recombinase family protein [Diaphorobacter caeni]